MLLSVCAITFLDLAQVREKLYRAFTTRASSTSVGEGDKSLDNEPHIARILELKQKMAGLLGYESYAEVSLASKVGVLCLFLSLSPWFSYCGVPKSSNSAQLGEKSDHYSYQRRLLTSTVGALKGFSVL